MPNFHLWQCNEEVTPEILARILQEGAVQERPLAARVAPFREVFAMVWPQEAAVQYRTHSFRNSDGKRLEVRTANPIAPFGAAHPFWIERIAPNESTGEAMVHGRLGGPAGLELAYFDPFYCDTHHLYKTDEVMAVCFAGLALRAERLSDTSLTITEGPAVEMERQRVREEDPNADIEKINSVTFDLSEMRAYLPSSEEEWADSGSFQTVLENIECLPGPCDVEIWKWDGTYVPEQEAWPALRFPVYLAVSRVQERLEDGAPWRGTIWLHGRPA